jgi:hypothetical protein
VNILDMINFSQGNAPWLYNYAYHPLLLKSETSKAPEKITLRIQSKGLAEETSSAVYKAYPCR